MEGTTMDKVQEDIESIKALVNAAKNTADVVAEVLADGKVGLADIAQLPSLFSNVKDILEALKGVKAEASDLDAAELKEVLTETLELVLHIGAKFGFGVK